MKAKVWIKSLHISEKSKDLRASKAEKDKTQTFLQVASIYSFGYRANQDDMQ